MTGEVEKVKKDNDNDNKNENNNETNEANNDDNANNDKARYALYFNLSGLSGANGNEGLNGYTFTWTPSNTDIIKAGNATITASSIKTTKEQLNSFVPYVELTTADGKITAIKWRIVDPKDPTKAVTAATDLKKVKVNIFYNNNKKRDRIEIDNFSNNTFEGTITGGGGRG